MTTRRFRCASLVSVALVAAIGLTACGEEEVPTVKPVADVPQAPALNGDQLERILADVESVGRAAEESGQAPDLAPRYRETAYDTRARNYEVREDFAERDAAPLVTSERLTDIVPIGGDWPRFAMIVTQGEGKQPPVLSVLSQAGVRDPYQEVATARLLPGQTFPSVNSADEGVETVALNDETGLLMSVEEATKHLSSVLKDGMGSQFYGSFAKNKFYDTIAEEQFKEFEAVTQSCEGCFDYEVSHTPVEGKAWAVRRADGGAIAVIVMDGVRSFTVAEEGAKLPLDGEIKAMADKAMAEKSLKLTSTEVLVLSIPPQGTDTEVAIVGVERTLMNVEAK